MFAHTHCQPHIVGLVKWFEKPKRLLFWKKRWSIAAFAVDSMGLIIIALVSYYSLCNNESRNSPACVFWNRSTYIYTCILRTLIQQQPESIERVPAGSLATAVWSHTHSARRDVFLYKQLHLLTYPYAHVMYALALFHATQSGNSCSRIGSKCGLLTDFWWMKSVWMEVLGWNYWLTAKFILSIIGHCTQKTILKRNSTIYLNLYCYVDVDSHFISLYFFLQTPS